MRGRWLAAVFCAAGLGVLGACESSPSTSPDSTEASVEAYTFDYVIPAGTQTRIDAGQYVDLLPMKIEAVVGDTLRIRNEDMTSYAIGPFGVGAGQTLTMRFSEPGVLAGDCDLTGVEHIRIEVRQ